MITAPIPCQNCLKAYVAIPCSASLRFADALNRVRRESKGSGCGFFSTWKISQIFSEIFEKRLAESAPSCTVSLPFDCNRARNNAEAIKGGKRSVLFRQFSDVADVRKKRLTERNPKFLLKLFPLKGSSLKFTLCD